ncbi:hypothetical protein ACWDBP_00515 [Streptomyces sp. NPDC001233]
MSDHKDAVEIDYDLTLGVRGILAGQRHAGLEIDPAEVAEAPWIDWRGVGPECWGPEM